MKAELTKMQTIAECSVRYINDITAENNTKPNCRRKTERRCFVLCLCVCVCVCVCRCLFVVSVCFSDSTMMR